MDFVIADGKPGVLAPIPAANFCSPSGRPLRWPAEPRLLGRPWLNGPFETCRRPRNEPNSCRPWNPGAGFGVVYSRFQRPFEGPPR